MKFRLTIFLVSLGLSAWAGGWYGILATVIVLGLIGFLIGPPRRDEIPTRYEQVEPEWEAFTPARKGSEIDPTRPTPEDYAALALDAGRKSRPRGGKGK